MQELAGSLSDKIKNDNPRQVINLCMTLLSIGCKLHTGLDNTLQLLISEQLKKSSEQPDSDVSNDRIVQAFQKELYRQIHNVERRSKQEISKLKSVNEQHILQTQELESKLETEKLFANRLKSERGIPEAAAAFYSKIEALPPVVALQQSLIMQRTKNPNDTNFDSYTFTRISEILAINGAQQMQEVGDIIQYDSMSHDRLEPSDYSRVTVVSPGFQIRNHEENIVIIKKAYVKDC